MAGLISILNWLITIAICILLIHSWWVLFDKMGEKGWKSLIPFYGKYILFGRVWEAKIYFISLALNAALVLIGGNTVIYGINNILAGNVTGIFAGSGGLLIFVGLFSCLSFTMQMMLNWRMTRCFGRGLGTFLGITFLPVIFLPILAYGSSYYDYY